MRASLAKSRFQAGNITESLSDVESLSHLQEWRANQLYDFACVYSAASAKIAEREQELADRGMELLRRP